MTDSEVIQMKTEMLNFFKKWKMKPDMAYFRFRNQLFFRPIEGNAEDDPDVRKIMVASILCDQTKF
jgi:hypothetical protein